MHEISCDICMDLLPLVRDGAASEDSAAAVKHHMETCDRCRDLFSGDVAPEEQPDRALRKAVKRVQAVSAAVGGLLVFLGILLCELVMQGGSVFFLLAAALIGGLLRIGFSKRFKKWGMGLRIAALLAAAALTAGLGWGFNEIFGNPVAKHRAEKLAESYVAQRYPQLQLTVGEADYEMKSATYRMEAVSETSMDTYFEVVTRKGKILYDTYAEDVAGKGNTLTRVQKVYSQAAEPALKLVGLEADIYHARAGLAIGPEAVELDGVYDAVALGEQYGVLDIMLGDETVTPERVAQLLLTIRQNMDEAGIPFATIDLELRSPKNPENPNDWRGTTENGWILLTSFRYEEIYPEDLTQRVSQANQGEA